MVGMTAGGARLVIGEEELLIARGVAATVAQARAEDPDVAVEEFLASEMTVGDLMAAVSPSLFGGGRVHASLVLERRDPRGRHAPAQRHLAGEPP